jgi:transitional endoplasmic reticulum ATPase
MSQKARAIKRDSPNVHKDEENIVWFDAKTIKQYSLQCGQYVPVSLSETKWIAKIEVGTHTDKSIHISTALSRSLGNKNGTLTVFLNGIRTVYTIEIAKTVKLTPHVSYPLLKQSERILHSQSNERVYQSGSTITLYVCEQPMYFTIACELKLFRIDDITQVILLENTRTPTLRQPVPGYSSLWNQITNLIPHTSGILLHGPCGVGKTHFIRTLVESMQIDFTFVNIANEVTGQELGDSERALRSIFEESIRKHHSIIVLDELDALEPRAVLELVHCFNYHICVIGITSHISRIDGSLKRVNRFEHEIEMTVPTPEMRREILQSMYPDMDVTQMILQTRGYVYADFAKRKIGTTVSDEQPASGMQDLVGIDDIKQRLHMSIIVPLTRLSDYVRIGVTPPRGVILYGPTGTGKTTLARAIGSIAKVNFISVTSPDIISKVVGESSRAISQLFTRARSCAPCILFFDQFEAIARARGTDSSESQSNDRMLSTLLIEMDGISKTSNHEPVIVLCATSRMDLLDPAVLRPGRIDQHVKLSLPDEKARLEILTYKTMNMPMKNRDFLSEIAKITDGYSGSQLENLCREAAMNCIRRGEEYVSRDCFDK